MKAKTKATFLCLSLLLSSGLMPAYCAEQSSDPEQGEKLSKSVGLEQVEKSGISSALQQAEQLSKNRDWRGSVQKYTAVLKVQADNAEALAGRGFAYSHLGEYKKALQDLNRAIELAPSSADIFTKRSLVYYWMRRFDLYKADAEKALSLTKEAPQDTDRLLYYAHMLDAIKRSEEAKAIYERVLADNKGKKDLESVVYLARANRSLGLNKDAVYFLTMAIKLAPNQEDLYEKRAYCYLALGRWDLAIADLNKLGKEPKPEPMNYAILAYCHRCQRQYKEAVENYTKALELDPEFHQLYLERGRAYHALQDHKNALNDFEKSIGADKENADAYREKAGVLLCLQMPKDALEQAKKAISLDPKVKDGYYTLGQANFGSQNYKEAIASMTKVIDADKEADQAFFWRGLAYRELRQYEEAVKDITAAIKLYQNEPKYFCARGAAQASLHNYQKAIADCTKSIALAPHRTHPYLTRGLSYARLGRYQLALKDLNQAIRQYPKYGDAYYQRSLVYRKLGLRARAKRDLQAAKKYGYGDPAAM
ncbi:MAG: tetratricopeptide repeat protein [Candidatus Obscuribacter phosphatis]|uniref:Tetratricopeptide repeat protein n=1 Tax=Candidatus Obscuribacter phosphatis TaxID=1906157 RepID=A0A8J7PFZ5_9BACT|nr:tetratricopeptide repeat protein [Candidatus Obscuribacter phosphatis]